MGVTSQRARWDLLYHIVPRVSNAASCPSKFVRRVGLMLGVLTAKTKTITEWETQKDMRKLWEA